MKGEYIQTTNGLKLSLKSRLQLTPEEKDQLKEYSDNDPAWLQNIVENTGLHRKTINAALTRGWLQVGPALKLREFLRLIKKAEIKL